MAVKVWQIGVVFTFLTIVLESYGASSILDFGQEDQPCPIGVSSSPPMTLLGGPFLPLDHFANPIPSGTNLCKASCGMSTCTYNLQKSMTTMPSLLFRCECYDTCPTKTMFFENYLYVFCDEVLATGSGNQCSCLEGQTAKKCTMSILPIQTTTQNYYCTCCKKEINNYSGMQISKAST